MHPRLTLVLSVEKKIGLREFATQARTA